MLNWTKIVKMKAIPLFSALEGLKLSEFLVTDFAWLVLTLAWAAAERLEQVFIQARSLAAWSTLLGVYLASRVSGGDIYQGGLTWSWCRGWWRPPGAGPRPLLLPRPPSRGSRPTRPSSPTLAPRLCPAWSRPRSRSGPCSQSWNWNNGKSKYNCIYGIVLIIIVILLEISARGSETSDKYKVAWLQVINIVCTTFEIMQKLLKLKNIINTQKTKARSCSICS